MTFDRGRSFGRSAVLCCALAFAFVGLAVTSTAIAAESDAPAAPSPITDFNKQLADVKKSLEAVNAKIDQSAKDFDTLSKPETARKQIENLQGVVANALGALADNGKVAQLGTKALDYAHAKRKQFETDTKYAPADRDYLLHEWQRISDETERATNELSDARLEFSQLLRTVQTRGDFIGELQAVDNAQRMLEVIRQLAEEIRSASATMKVFIKTVVPPGT